jgi:hypothetical protein
MTFMLQPKWVYVGWVKLLRQGVSNVQHTQLFQPCKSVVAGHNTEEGTGQTSKRLLHKSGMTCQMNRLMEEAPEIQLQSSNFNKGMGLPVPGH